VPHPATPQHGGRLVAAALLVGALAGGAAGFGGAAILNNNQSTTAGAGQSNLAIAPVTGQLGSGGGTTESAAARILPSVVKIYASSPTVSGSGSGIILTKSGEILTNNHVAELALGGGRLAVSFNNGKTVPATIVGRDPLTDLAVIKAEGIGTATPATLGSSAVLQVGQPVVAVGAPYGLESTVTTGVVSALDRPVTTQGEGFNDPQTIFPAIQTDAAINPGNSGGPLVNLSGQVIGINSAIHTATSGGLTGQQGGSIGLGFAIPIDEAIPIVNQLQAGQRPTHARIGVLVGNASSSLGITDGAKVEHVDANSAGAAAGLSKGDVITRVDGQQITDADSLVAITRTYRPGDTINLSVVTSTGQQRTVTLKLGSDG
ncbi:MAG: S1C family serine protease, partial [Nocardioidaceae bacterium]